MVRTWSADNPKAALMARKRTQIVDAALEAFLESGYAATSVNLIAARAGVSIKTLYRHFDDKDDLFSAVMQAACGTSESDSSNDTRPWYDLPPADALVEAGREYLEHALSAQQVALYRVVVRDAGRFPELGRRYAEQTVAIRDHLVAGYLARWAAREGWRVSSPEKVAQAFVALLKARVFEEVLLEAREVSSLEIDRLAADAARALLVLLQDGEY